MISILTSYLPVFTNIMVIPESEAAISQTVWEFNYTGGEQTFVVPYDGIYKIETYGAQGGNVEYETEDFIRYPMNNTMTTSETYGSTILPVTPPTTVTRKVLGGKGSYQTGEISLGKNSSLAIYVGGQDGYNGGGESYGTYVPETTKIISQYGNGGGASDIRINGNTTSNRILVAGGGGGANVIGDYHSHSDDCNRECTITTTSGGKHQEVYPSHSSSCTSAVWIEKYTVTHSSCGKKKAHDNYLECPVCGNKGGDRGFGATGRKTHTYIGCGKSEGVSSYTENEGSATAKRHQGNNHIGSLPGGGGGYYGGDGELGGISYAGTSYASSNLSNTATQEGAREGNGYVKITLLRTSPSVSVSVNNTASTNQNLVLTATASDAGGFPAAPYSWQGGARTSSNTYTITKNGTYQVNVINNDNLTATASINITNIDKIPPVINSIIQSLTANKKQTVLTVNATDNGNADYAASGIVGYAITTSNTPPAANNFQASNRFAIDKNGTYYAWAKDRAGNISQLTGTTGSGSSTTVKNIEVEIQGSIIWNDNNNQYNSRRASTLHIYRKVGTNGAEEKVADIAVTTGNTNYTWQTRECNDNGNKYIFRIAEDYIAGYETTYEGNNVSSNQTQNIRINVGNNIILPQYTSKIEYNLIEGFRGEYLKNTKLEMVATIEANRNNQGKTGVNKSTAVYVIDEGFTIDKSNIQVIYTDGTTGQQTQLNSYTTQNNNIIVEYGQTAEHVTKAGDKLTIRVQGEFSQIKSYNNSITLTGKLTDYQGTNTTVDLGNITRSEKNFEVRYQKPVGRIQIRKTDSITEENLTDATFTLYEWNGREYVEKEILRDENRDGIYTSNYYAWNQVTQGKYKVVETGIPLNHKDLDFSMEYVIDQLQPNNYTITPDYNNGNYRIAYGVRNPDDFDRALGIVENEPYKIKARITNIDSETKKPIQGNAEYTIYEWNKETGVYAEYISKINGRAVKMVRKADKTYETNEWLYYTKTNEGKYKIVETTPATGYYGDYDENGNKRQYNINILDIVNSGKYENQETGNEGTIQLFNNEEKTSIESKRVSTQIKIQLIDSESKGEAQGSGNFGGVEYEIYAKEQINHPDGITTRYEGEPGVIYKQNELIRIVSTNEEGKISIEDLECGKYYIKQHSIPEGYLKDEISHEINIEYKGQEMQQVKIEEFFENKVKKQAFQILKQQIIGNNQFSPLANAGFKIYQIKDLTIVKEGKITKNEDGSYTLNDEEAQKDAWLTKKANSDGSYNIGVLVDYYYKINYNEENMKQLPQSEHAYHPYDLKGENVVKNYANTQQGEEIEENISNQNGYLKSPELAYGEYIVIETSVPHNKEAILPITIKVTIDSREAQNLRYVTDPNFEAKIKVYAKDNKTGEVIQKGGTKFVIKDKETGNLLTYEGWNLLEGTVEYGTYERPFETNKEGYIKMPMKFKIGNYELIQLESPEGYILRGYEGHSENGETIKTPKENVNFKIETNQIYYVDNERENNIIVVNEENQAQVGSIKITNTGDYFKGINNDSKKESKIEYETKGVEGATYHVNAKEEIQSKDGKTKLYNAGDLVTIVATNEEGKAYAENLPQGKYEIKQVEKGNGFGINGEEREINITYGGEEAQKTPVTYYEENYKDETTKLEIELIDKDTKEKLEGIEMELYRKKEDGSEELIQSFTTGKTNFYIERIPEGNYIIRQPKGQKKLGEQGYVTNEDVEVTLEAKKDIQKVTIKQPVTILIIKGGEDGLAPGTIVQIIDKETGEVIKEVTMGEGDEIIEKLPEGDYIIHIEDVDYDKGYVKGDDIEITITDSNEILEIQHKQDYTKVEINLLDIDTKEPVIGGTLTIVDKKGKEVTEKWVTDGKPHRIDKLPIGEYYLVETQAPTLKGYVRTEKVAFEVKETKEVQKVEMLQDYTRIEIKPTDKDTGEEIKDIELVIKDDKGNEVGKVTIGKDDDTNHIIDRLPVGDYVIESTKVPYGYKPINTVISIKDKQGIQGGDELKITIEKEEFDLKVETKVQEIKRNGKVEYKKKEDTKEQTHKVDIKDKKIKSEQIEVIYQIKVQNQKKITGQVGRVEVEIPAGMTFIASNNKTYWKEEKGKVITEGLKGRELKSGDCAEIPLVLNWKNGLENFGTKKIQVEIKEVVSDIGFKEINLENNKAVSEEVIIGVSTGEMNLVYMCWILLGILILTEIYLSRKTKMKAFYIKDKTTKWRQ